MLNVLSGLSTERPTEQKVDKSLAGQILRDVDGDYWIVGIDSAGKTGIFPLTTRDGSYTSNPERIHTGQYSAASSFYRAEIYFHVSRQATLSADKHRLDRSPVTDEEDDDSW